MGIGNDIFKFLEPEGFLFGYLSASLLYINAIGIQTGQKKYLII